MLVHGNNIVNFILGGNCHCAIQNVKTGNAFEYKIKQGRIPQVYFIKVRNLGTSVPLVYAGLIKVNRNGIAYKKENKDETDVSIQALLYVLRNYKRLPACVLVEHFGTCGRCGRKLTDEESIKRGLGPECAKKVLF